MKIDYKKTFTSYWQYIVLKTACKTQIFDFINEGYNTREKLVKKGNFNLKVLTYLLKALEDLETIKILDSKIILTKEGGIFTENHPNTLKYACIHWGEEHMRAWQNLEYTLKTGNPAFENIFKKPLFDYLSEDKKRLEIYHKAMGEYARDDYVNICEVIDFNQHHNILDVGGGLGALISIIASKFPQKNCVLFDRPEVIKISERKNIKKIGGDFFKQIPSGFDAIILSRVLHDWDVENASRILNNVNKALQTDGKLYIIENLPEKISDNATLLSLNMLLITKSYERTLREYSILLKKEGFGIIKTKQINKLQHAIICKKIN